MQKTFCDGCGSEIDAERPQASAVGLSGEIGDRSVIISVVTSNDDGSIPDVCWRCVANVVNEYGPYRKSPFDKTGISEMEPMALPPERPIGGDESEDAPL